MALLRPTPGAKVLKGISVTPHRLKFCLLRTHSLCVPGQLVHSLPLPDCEPWKPLMPAWRLSWYQSFYDGLSVELLFQAGVGQGQLCPAELFLKPLPSSGKKNITFITTSQVIRWESILCFDAAIQKREGKVLQCPGKTWTAAGMNKEGRVVCCGQ